MVLFHKHCTFYYVFLPITIKILLRIFMNFLQLMSLNVCAYSVWILFVTHLIEMSHMSEISEYEYYRYTKF